VFVNAMHAISAVAERLL